MTMTGKIRYKVGQSGCGPLIWLHFMLGNLTRSKNVQYFFTGKGARIIYLRGATLIISKQRFLFFGGNI